MDWVALLISGLIFPSVWWFARKHNQLKLNELAHVAEDIKEVKADVKALTEKFITHLEGHE